MLDKLRDFAEKYDMLSSGDVVVCGLSGGADSVCLLLSMREISREIGFSVEALHVNHCLRGDESDRDEEFCRCLCSRLKIPFKAVSCDVRGYAEKFSLSTEEAARELRYAIFRDNSHGKKIATAHNADDNLETVILNLVRGTAVKGLCGIPPVRDNIIRPMLAVTRREIEEFLDLQGQDYVTDSTNLTEDYTRNKIRRRIIPVMRELNASLTETSVNTIDGIRSENDFIESETAAALEKCLKNGVLSDMSDYDEVIRRRCAAKLLRDNGLLISHKRLEECGKIMQNGGKLNISGNIYFVSDGKNSRLEKIIPKSEELISIPLKIGENSLFPDTVMICEIVECESLTKIDFVNKKLTFSLLDYDKIIGKAVVRNRKYGDRIRLSGRDFTSSVKKIINEKIPKNIRPTLYFIEDGEGIVFGEMIGVAQRVTPDENTKRLLKITVIRK